LLFAKQNDNQMILKVIFVILIWVLWELFFYGGVGIRYGVEEEFVSKAS